jgi:hypothetical protein
MSELELDAPSMSTPNASRMRTRWDTTARTADQTLSTLAVFNNNDVDIKQDSYSLNGGRYSFEGFRRRDIPEARLCQLRGRHVRVRERDRIPARRQPVPRTEIASRAMLATLERSKTPRPLSRLSTNATYPTTWTSSLACSSKLKERDTTLIEEAARIRFNLPAGTAVPTTGTRPFTGFAPVIRHGEQLDRAHATSTRS